MQTRMERIDILKVLRRPETVFPHGWDESDLKRSRQGRIIRWCLAHDPVKRAGPLDLLRSDLLPAAVQAENIADTLSLLCEQSIISFWGYFMKYFLQLNQILNISRLSLLLSSRLEAIVDELRT